MAGRKFKPSQPPGVAGGRRHIPDAIQRQQAVRAADKRVQSSLGRTRAEQDALDALIIRQQQEADEQDARDRENHRLQLVFEAEQRDAATRARNDEHEAEMARRRERWPLGDARNLVRSGYTVEHTSLRTGWAPEELEDVEFGVWE
jgi:hypothetical protein